MPRPSRKRIRAALAQSEASTKTATAPICPLCGRPIPPGALSSRHHLVPRLKGGTHKGTVLLHQICHNAIHARYSEAELAARLNSIEALRADPDMAGFIAWVKTKPRSFHARTEDRKRTEK